MKVNPTNVVLCMVIIMFASFLVYMIVGCKPLPPATYTVVVESSAGVMTYHGISLVTLQNNTAHFTYGGIPISIPEVDAITMRLEAESLDRDARSSYDGNREE
jgi:hypothetical protein